MGEKIYLGKVKDDWGHYVSGEKLWIDKHTWDCDWYWGFGYIGNGHLHTHFDNVFLSHEDGLGDVYDVKKIFEQNKTAPNIDQNTWWTLRDLFIQAYALQKAAEVYRYGGHQTHNTDTQIIKDEKMCLRINADLEVILDKIWDILTAYRRGK